MGTMLEVQEDGVAGPCMWIVELAEALSDDGQIEMARSLSSTILSLWKGLSREESARLRRIIRTRRKHFHPRRSEGANVSNSTTPNHRGGS